MSAVCPACGVPVVAGYVKCPKCHAALPYGRGRGARPTEAGGTTVREARGFPIAAVAVALLVGGGIIAVFAMKGGKKEPAAEAVPVAAPVAIAPVPPPTAVADTPTAPVPAPRLAPETVAAELRSALGKQKLWSTVSLLPGALLEVRSRSCNEAATGQLVAAAGPRFREAGLTKVRCVEESGGVVWQRDL